jgi:tetratricopeptide (TPR) repeat protein
MYRIVTTLYLFLSFFLSFSNDSFSLFPDYQVEERNKAIELFHNRNFSEALPIFKKLSDAYPSDYLLKYFTGACMVETGDMSKETEMYLLLAGSREVPAKVHYYLGRYYHSKEDWDNALRFYNRFRNNSQEPEISSLRIDALIQNAFDAINPFAAGGPVFSEKKEETQDTLASGSGALIPEPEQQPEVMPVDTVIALAPTLVLPVTTEDDSSLVISSETANNQKDVTIAGEAADQPVVKPDAREKKQFIRFQVNSQVTYLSEDLFQVAEAKEAWKAATAAEADLKSTLDTLEVLRQRYLHPAHLSDRAMLTDRIITLERQSLQKKADSESLFQKARTLEQEWWEEADLSVYEKFAAINDSIARLEEALRIAALPPPVVIDDSLIIEENEFSIEEEDEEADDSGVIYKVQLGSYAKGVKVPVRTQALFDKISKIRTIDTFINEDGATVYTTGNMKTFADGQALQNQVRLEGVKDAFVIAIQDGKRISLQDAKIITGEE